MISLSIDRQATVPLVDQIRKQISSRIYFGDLQGGDRLPSVRELASQLGVAKSTVHRIYSELEEQGILETRPRSGVYIRGDGNDLLSLNAVRFKVLRQTVQQAENLALTPEHLLVQLRRLMGFEAPRARFGMVSAQETYEIVIGDLPDHVAGCVEWVPPRGNPHRRTGGRASAVDYLITTYVHRQAGARLARVWSVPRIQLLLRPERCQRLFSPLQKGIKCLVWRDRDVVDEANAVISAGFTPRALERVWCLHLADKDLRWACEQAQEIWVSPACAEEFDRQLDLPRHVFDNVVAEPFVQRLLYHIVFG